MEIVSLIVQQLHASVISVLALALMVDFAKSSHIINNAIYVAIYQYVRLHGVTSYL